MLLTAETVKKIFNKSSAAPISWLEIDEPQGRLAIVHLIKDCQSTGKVSGTQIDPTARCTISLRERVDSVEPVGNKQTCFRLACVEAISSGEPE